MNKLKIFRIIDANINRASEAARVLEDYCRFSTNNEILSKKLKIIRHQIRKKLCDYNNILIEARAASFDLGFNISQNMKIDNKKDEEDIFYANFKRLQESLRSIEESLKILSLDNLSKQYEKIRFESYVCEEMFKAKKFIETDLYCITGEKFSLGRSNIEVVKQMIDSGIKIIQYREKEKSIYQKYKELEQIRKLTAQNDVLLIVNDNIDLALVSDADGVHVGQKDLPLLTVRKLVGNKIIGISTHAEEEALEAQKNGADYIGVGPIFKTKTKEDVVDPVGYEYLDFVVKNITIPFVAIGGIKESNILSLKKAGAKCFAMITQIVGAENIKETIGNIRKKIA